MIRSTSYQVSWEYTWPIALPLHCFRSAFLEEYRTTRFCFQFMNTGVCTITSGISICGKGVACVIKFEVYRLYRIHVLSMNILYCK